MGGVIDWCIGVVDRKKQNRYWDRCVRFLGVDVWKRLDGVQKRSVEGTAAALGSAGTERGNVSFVHALT